MGYVVTPPAVISLPIRGSEDRFPVRRIYCVGRNYAAHAVEMGHDPDREPPFFFQKNPDNLVLDGRFPYPPRTQRRASRDRAGGGARRGRQRHRAASMRSGHVFGYAVGIDMTRRDLQGEAKKLGRPWEVGKAFEHSALCGELVPARDDRPSGARRDLARRQRRAAPGGRPRPADLEGAGGDRRAVQAVRAGAGRSDHDRHAGRRRRGRPGRRHARRRRRGRRDHRRGRLAPAMVFDPASPTLTLGVVGAGTMGRGIAQIAAAAGIEVRLIDARTGAAEEARGFIARMLERQVEKGAGAADARAAIERVRIVGRRRRPRAVRSGGRGDRRGLFRQAAPVRRPRAGRARRCGAGHQHLVALGHRDRGGLQEAGAGGGLALLQPGAADEGGRGDSRPAHRRAGGRRRCRRSPCAWAIARCAPTDSPGFLVNHAGRGYGTEALRILAEGHRDARSRSTASCARRPAFAWGRSSSSTWSGSTSRMR